jgi:hypothetical protein
MMLNRTLIATLLAASFSLLSTSAFAASVNLVDIGSVVNAGFEQTSIDEVVKSGDPFLIDNWDLYLAGGFRSGPRNFYGVFAPNGAYYDPLDPVPTPPVTSFYAPEGSKIAYFDLTSNSGSPCSGCSPTDGTYPVGMYQELTSKLDASDPTIDYGTLLPNSRYDLSVAIGNPKSGVSFDYDDFGGYRIELLAGEEVIAFDDNTQSWVNDPNDDDYDEGTFKEASLFFETGTSLNLSGSELMRAALGIRLIHKNAGVDPDPLGGFYWGVGFDDVQLSVSPVPVPAAVWLFGTALIGLIGFGKRRKIA